MDENEKKDLQLIQEFQNVFSPSTILGVFANALRTSADNKIILAKGEFHPVANGREYAGYFYDDIKSPNDNKFLKAKIPALLRSKLESNNIYIFKGYIEKRISNSSIELLYVVDEVLQKEENSISEEDIRRFEIIQKKVSKGFKDLEAVIKEHIYNNNIFNIVNIYGTTGIVNRDFEAGLAEGQVKYKITECRCNLSSKAEIINALRKFNTSENNALALVRGGGDKSSFEVFNDPEVGEEILKLKPMFITALGHVVDENLADKIADRKFHLPLDYGNKLKVWVDEATAEQAKSKSLFIDQVKKDLTKTFEEQIKTLTTQLEAKNKEYADAQLKFKEMIEQNQKDKLEAIQSKEKVVEAQIKSLQEQIKAKEDSLKIIQINNEETSKQMVKMATAESQIKLDGFSAENKRLQEQLTHATKASNRIIIYLIIAAIIGLVIGLII